ncbi:putative ubiquitin-conjugating enzyme E2 23 isoform X2 [Carex rostrata]
MDPGATAKLFPHSSKMNLFPGTSSYSDPDVIEVGSSSSWSSNNQKRKRSQVIPHDIIQIDEDDDPDGVVIIGETLPNPKHKPPLILPMPNSVLPMASQHSMDWQMHMQGPFGLFANPSSSTIKPPLPGKTAPMETSTPTVQDFSFADYEYFKDDDFFDEDYDNLDYGNTAMDTDPSFNLEDKFFGLDIPTGVEAPVPWMQKCFGSGSGSSSGSKGKQPKVVDDEIDINYKAFKQFDTVRDYTDHYYMRSESKFKSSQKPTKEWTKRVQNDWKLLEKDLPESIFVRVYEDRMDLLRAVIIGPAGTPYHDGLFFFDVFFPPTYPLVPPMVYYNSGGLRLNPNLYACGKVCLSLLNTWSGSGCERWNSANSTMLQVLVSIQALVLNSKPYFNEPGYTAHANTPYGEQKSVAYNENTFLLSCKTMLYSLRRPPKHFEHFVAGHFRTRGYAILVACRAYMEGAQVGCLFEDGVQDVDEGDKSSSDNFKTSLKRIFDDLLMEFNVKGADCDEFLPQKGNRGSAAVLAVPTSQPTPITVTMSPFVSHSFMDI